MCSYLQIRLIIYTKHHQNNKILLSENVIKTCKTSTEPLEKSINLEAKNIANKLHLVERVECRAKKASLHNSKRS